MSQTFTLTQTERSKLLKTATNWQPPISSPPANQGPVLSLAVSSGPVQGEGTLKIELFSRFCEVNALDPDSKITKRLYERFLLSCALYLISAGFEPTNHIAVFMLVSPCGNYRSRCNNRQAHDPDFVFGERLWGVINTKLERRA